MFPTNKNNLLKHLKDFSQNEIVNYSSKRNYDLGTPHNNVSKLSPFLKRRFISEEEVLRIILKNNEMKNIVVTIIFNLQVIKNMNSIYSV